MARRPTQLDRFESLTLFVDGDPLVLDVVGWTPEAVGASHPSLSEASGFCGRRLLRSDGRPNPTHRISCRHHHSHVRFTGT